MAVWCVNKILPLMEYSQLNYFNMKLKFGAIVVAGSGKIGGHVASKNKAGAYLRTKVTPSNPRTTYQTNVRERLTGLSQGWRSLTDAQRNSWNNAVANFKRSNVFGDIKIPSGFNLYQRINNNILTIGGTILTVPPTPSSVATYSNAVLTAAAGTPALSLSFTVVAGTVAGYKLFATAPVSPGRPRARPRRTGRAALPAPGYALAMRYQRCPAAPPRSAPRPVLCALRACRASLG